MGRFLMAHLLVDALLKPLPKSLSSAKSRLKELPERLDDIYDGVLMRIEAQESTVAALARQLLKWVFYAFEPLTVTQLQTALAFEIDDTVFDEDKAPERD